MIQLCILLSRQIFLTVSVLLGSTQVLADLLLETEKIFLLLISTTFHVSYHTIILSAISFNVFSYISHNTSGIFCLLVRYIAVKLYALVAVTFFLSILHFNQHSTYVTSVLQLIPKNSQGTFAFHGLSILDPKFLFQPYEYSSDT